MRALVLMMLSGCNLILGNGDFKTGGAGDDGGVPVDAFDPCLAQGMPTTSLSGTVFAPNGTLPLYGAAVYVPTTTLATIPDGVSAPTCVSGSPVAVVRSDSAGHFKLDNVPSGDVRLVVQVGKWRREVTVPDVQACMDNPVTAQQTRLPKNTAEGSLPHVAITTGAADSLECIPREFGVDDAEFTTGAGSTGHVHLYVENGTGQLVTGPLDSAVLLYNPTMLTAYDIIMFGCPGMASPNATPATANPLKLWTDQGGWLFLTHLDSAWLMMGSLPWPTLASFNGNATTNPTGVISIDTTTPIGQTYSDWLVAVGASITPSQVPLMNGKNSCDSIDATRVTRRMFLDPVLNMNASGVQGFTFEALNGGRVTFDDVHVSATPGSSTTIFPSNCATTTPTPQEKALIFQLFETPTCGP